MNNQFFNQLNLLSVSVRKTKVLADVIYQLSSSNPDMLPITIESLDGLIWVATLEADNAAKLMDAVLDSIDPEEIETMAGGTF